MADSFVRTTGPAVVVLVAFARGSEERPGPLLQDSRAVAVPVGARNEFRAVPGLGDRRERRSEVAVTPRITAPPSRSIPS
jgi:hypothetical protein